ncbi:MAG: ATP-binding protein [Candidatus Omnitrophica bacterium]|nr:ATP-binding protein [Candidatus Omnitrophota bacterium]
MNFLGKRKRILKRSIVFLFLTVVIGAVDLVLRGMAGRLSITSIPFPAWVVTNTLLAVILYKVFDQLVMRSFKSIIFPHRLRPLAKLIKVSRELGSILDLNELGNVLVNSLADFLALKNASLLVWDKSCEAFTVVSAAGISLSESRKICLSGKSLLADKLARAHCPIFNNTIEKHLSWHEASEVARALEELRSSVLLPLKSDGELIGCIGLGRRLRVASYGSTERRALGEFASSAARAVRNAVKFGELKVANNELRDIQSKLLQETKRLAIEQLASGIAHEIHNPLTVISGKAQVLLLNKDKANFKSDAEEVLKTIVRQTQRAADITKRLLSFARPSFDAVAEPIDFENIIRNTVALVSYQASMDEIETAWFVGPDLPVLRGNLQEFQEIFFNLILNAVEAIGKRGRVNIAVRRNRAKETVQISVSDTGAGIREENISQVFNPFFTRREGGVGLGLFLVQQIVHRYGGTIQAESKVARGSVFTIEFMPCGALDKNQNSGEESAAEENDSQPARRELSRFEVLSRGDVRYGKAVNC